MSFSGTKGWITKPPPGSVEDPFHPLSQGCVCHLLMNEGGGSKIYDISGHGNHGTLNGPSWRGSQFGGGLDFDGSTNYVDCGSDKSLDDLTAFSWEFWMYLNSYGQGNLGRPLCKKKDITDMFVHTAPDCIVGRINTTDGGFSAQTADNSIILKRWYHITFTYDDNGDRKPRIYINGFYSGTSGTATGTRTSDADTNLEIGRRVDGLRQFDGSIDSVRIYNRALPAWEIETLYHDPWCNLLRVPIRRYYSPAVAADSPS